MPVMKISVAPDKEEMKRWLERLKELTLQKMRVYNDNRVDALLSTMYLDAFNAGVKQAVDKMTEKVPGGSARKKAAKRRKEFQTAAKVIAEKFKE